MRQLQGMSKVVFVTLTRARTRAGSPQKARQRGLR